MTNVIVTATATLIYGSIVVASLNCQNEICLTNDYDRTVMPPVNSPMKIKVRPLKIDLKAVKDNEMSLMLDMKVAVIWKDPRVAVGNATKPFLTLSRDFGDKLWMPDLGFSGVKDVVNSQSVGNGLKGAEQLLHFVSMYPEQEVGFYQHIAMEFWCRMEFSRFPKDEQTCNYGLLANRHDSNQVQLTLDHSDNTELVGDDNLDFNSRISFIPSRILFHSGLQANVSFVGFKINLKRKIQRHLVESILPSGTFVVLSWLGFLVPPEIVPGRLGLLVTLFLCQINTLNNIMETNPKSNEGPNAILIWTCICIAFITGAMGVYGWILYKHLNCIKDVVKEERKFSKRAKEPKKSYRTGYRLDMTMLFFFPPTYSLAAIAFWVAV